MFKKSTLTNLVGGIASTLAVAGASQAQEQSGDFNPEHSIKIRLLEESLTYNNGDEALFYPLPTVDIESQWTDKLSTRIGYKIYNQDNQPLYNSTDVEFKPLLASLSYDVSDSLTLTAGKLFPKRGTVWFDAFPQQVGVGTDEVNFANVAISSPVGVEATYTHGPVASEIALVKANDGSGPTALIGKSVFGHDFGKTSVGIGVEAALQSGGGFDATETSYGGFLKASRSFGRIDTLVVAEQTHFNNLAGTAGDSADVTSIYAHAVMPLSERLAGHVAGSINKDLAGDWSQSLEAGIGYSVTEKLTGYAATGMDCYETGPRQGCGHNYQIGFTYQVAP